MQRKLYELSELFNPSILWPLNFLKGVQKNHLQTKTAKQKLQSNLILFVFQIF